MGEYFGCASLSLNIDVASFSSFSSFDTSSSSSSSSFTLDWVHRTVSAIRSMVCSALPLPLCSLILPSCQLSLSLSLSFPSVSPSLHLSLSLSRLRIPAGLRYTAARRLVLVHIVVADTAATVRRLNRGVTFLPSLSPSPHLFHHPLGHPLLFYFHQPTINTWADLSRLSAPLRRHLSALLTIAPLTICILLPRLAFIVPLLSESSGKS